jgi:hypothetical protein
VEVRAGALVITAGATFDGGQAIGDGQVVLAGGGVTLGGTVLQAQVIQNGAALAGNNRIVGALNWTAGNWNGAPSVTVAEGSRLDVMSDNQHDMAGCILTNAGTIRWIGGALRGGGFPVTRLENEGTFEIRSDRVFNADYGANGVVVNNWGLIRKYEGAGTTTFNGGVVLNGGPGSLVQIDAGSVVIGGGGSSVGRFLSGVGTALAFTGGYTLTNGMVFDGPGALTFASGSFRVAGTLRFTTLTQTGGSLGGTNIVLKGSYQYQAGAWRGAVPVTIPDGSELVVLTDNLHDIFQSTVVNLGTVRWLGGPIRGGSIPGTRLENRGVWEIRCDQILNADYGAEGVLFLNSGTLRKSVATGATSFTGGVSFRSTGVVDLQTGAINLYGGGRLTGGSVSGPGARYLASGLFQILDATLSPNVQEVGGGLLGENRILGGLTWVAGTWNSATSVSFLGQGTQCVISSDNLHDLANCTVTNQGTVMWLGGSLRGGGNPGSRIYNQGRWYTQCDRVVNSDYGLNGLSFINQGAFTKATTTGATTFQASALDKSFVNRGGDLAMALGSVVLQQGFTQGGGTVTAGLAGKSPGAYGQLASVAPVQLSGPLNVQLAGDYVPQVGDEFLIVASSLVSGTFAPGTIPNGISLNYRKDGVYLGRDIPRDLPARSPRARAEGRKP